MQGKRLDLTGQRFGMLTVLRKSEHKGKSGGILWLCRCDCGVEKEVLANSLRQGKTRSCGCKQGKHTNDTPNADTISAIQEVESLKKDPNKQVYSSFSEVLQSEDLDDEVLYDADSILNDEDLIVYDADSLFDEDPRLVPFYPEKKNENTVSDYDPDFTLDDDPDPAPFYSDTNMERLQRSAAQMVQQSVEENSATSSTTDTEKKAVSNRIGFAKGKFAYNEDFERTQYVVIVNVCGDEWMIGIYQDYEKAHGAILLHAIKQCDSINRYYTECGEKPCTFSIETRQDNLQGAYTEIQVTFSETSSSCEHTVFYKIFWNVENP